MTLLRPKKDFSMAFLEISSSNFPLKILLKPAQNLPKTTLGPEEMKGTLPGVWRSLMQCCRCGSETVFGTNLRNKQ